MQRARIVFVVTFLGVGCSKASPPPSRADDINANAYPASAGESPRPTTDVAAALPPESNGEAVASPPPSTDGCGSARCSADSYCDLKTVECIRAPCPPIPTCVVGTHPCAAATCLVGSRCEAVDGKASCIPMAEGGGSDAGPPCGSATCDPGKVCCNASCGICTAPDEACIQIACE